MSSKQVALEFDQQLAALDLSQRIEFIDNSTQNATFTTSLGKEDQLITHLIDAGSHNISIAAINTRRLFPQTIELLDTTRQRYQTKINEYLPDNENIKTYEDSFGANGFYESVEARHECCRIRKLVPLEEILNPADAWITGLRREQSNNRAHVPFCEYSDKFQVLKFNPLADLTSQLMDELIAKHDVPINPLHDKGFPSIGCEPCTRAVKPGEDERAGRWWWENDNSRECGLHQRKTLQTNE